MSLLNRRRVKMYLIDEAKRTGKTRLDRVSASTYRWLEEELTRRMNWLVSVHAHGGPKTITAPK